MFVTRKEPLGSKKKTSLKSGRELLFLLHFMEIFFAVIIVVLRSIYARANKPIPRQNLLKKFIYPTKPANSSPF